MPNGKASILLLLAGVCCGLPSTVNIACAYGPLAQDQSASQGLTPLQLEIEKLRQRLSSVDEEDRREAVVRLGALHRAAASRVTVPALSDPSPIVRATATAAVLSLPPDESTAGLIPLLSDKEEFVRQQAAYALGQTRSRAAVADLIERLGDKEDSVRGAAAVALGQIGDAGAVNSLVAVLSQQPLTTSGKKNRKNKTEKNQFVLRAAAHSLGQIGNGASVPVLVAVLQDDKAEGDVRREAAFALGMIGDAAALPTLRVTTTAADPYLSAASQEAIRRISRQ